MVFKNPGKLCMSPGTLEIPVEMFALNRKRLVEKLKQVNAPLKSAVLLEGGSDVPFNDTDVNFIFRQESYFMWAFGVLEPDCFGAIEVDSGRAHLFIPRLPESFAVWMGPLHTTSDFANKYWIPNVHYVDEIADVLKSVGVCNLLLLSGVNSDSGVACREAKIEGANCFKIDKTTLYNVISDLRVVKTAMEVKVMKYVSEISSSAHREIMRAMKPGKSEYNYEAKFLYYCYNSGGCRNHSYTCICGSGPNSAVLHYGHAGAPNDRVIKPGEMVLFDMGANYFGYCSDITCSFPVDGKFTTDQKMVYEAVLDANQAVMKAAKPGVSWVDMHILANKVMLTALKAGGLIKGYIDDMIEDGLAYTFQPHGLGHLIGLDVHDVGGYLSTGPPRPIEPLGAHKLRTARVLEEGMTLTIEPGCYFIDSLLDAALRTSKLSKFIIPEVLRRFRGFGGVRIEDVVVITSAGAKSLVKVPRTVQEIEKWMADEDNDKYCVCKVKNVPKH